MARLVFLLIVITLLLANSAAYASCAPPDRPLQALQRSDAVFSGEVINVGGSFIHRAFGVDAPVTFEVRDSWKGVTTTSTTIFNMSNSVLAASSVEFPFKQGEHYLVYANRDSDTGNLVTNGCYPTKVLEEAADDLRELGPPSIVLQPEAAPRGSLWGLPAALSLLVLPLIVLFMRRQRRLREG